MTSSGPAAPSDENPAHPASSPATPAEAPSHPAAVPPANADASHDSAGTSTDSGSAVPEDSGIGLRRRIQIGSRRGMVPKTLATPHPRTYAPTVSGAVPAKPAALAPASPVSEAPVAATPVFAPPAAVPSPPVEPTALSPRPPEPEKAPPKSEDEEPGPRIRDDVEMGAPVVKRVVPPPSRRDRLSPELEQELNAAMAGVALDAIASSTVAASAVPELEPETRLHAILVRIHGDNAFFSLGGRNEGVVSIRQFRERPSIGTEMEVVVKKYQAEEGLYELVVPGQSVSVGDWADLTEGAVVEARITGANTGGLECMVNHIRGFIPSSQIGLFRVEDFAQYIGQKLLCVATEVNRRRKNLVLSHRALAEREKEEARRKFLEELEPGQTREGVVRSIQDFGAFVDLGGVDGLIHVSQLSWDRVNHPSEVLHEGQKVRVKVEKVNRQTGKIGLSYRDLLEHPWSHVEEKFPAGGIVKGTVSRIAKFGAFVKLAPGVEGLIHISELAHHRVRGVSDVVSEGQEIEVKVLSIDPQAQRIALSLKAALPEPEREETVPAAGAAESSSRESHARRPTRPLKGGFDRPTGGDRFGLKW